MLKLVWLTLIAIGLFVISFPFSVVAYGATGTFDISGIVVNNTDISEPVDDSLVTLSIRRLNNPNEEQQITTGVDGTFTFINVDYYEDALYEVSVLFDSVTYKKNVDISTGETSQPNIIITVYSASDSSDIVSIYNTSILFTDVDVRASRIFVMEMVTLQNETNFTYIPGDGPMDLLRFGLPNGTEGLYVEPDISQADWLQVDKGFALITPISPGKHEMLYTYNFPYEGSDHVMSRKWRYGAENVRILIPREMANIKTDLGNTANPITIGDMDYLAVEDVAIKRNQNMTIEFTNLPQHNMLQKIIYPPEKVNYYYAAPIALFLLLLIFVVFAIIRVIRTSGSSYSEAQADYEEKIVKDMINKLDSQLENGCINKSEYERRLYILMRRENEIAGK